MNIKSLWNRKGELWRYFRDGFGILTLPLSVISFATTTYYLAIDNIAFLKIVFPNFYVYLIAIGLFVPPIGIIFGWLQYKRMGLFGSQIKIATESNPIAAYTLMLSYENMFDMRKKLGLPITPELQEVYEYYKRLHERWQWSPK